jgi:hypothetical protein
MPQWQDKNLFDRIFDLLHQIERKHVKFNRARDSIVDYFRPDLGSDVDPDGDGTFFGENIYDGIGPWAVGVMARGHQGGLVSADADWLAHETKRPELDDVDELDLWLQEVKGHVSAAYQNSNFYRVLPNFTKDGITIGSPLMFIEESDVVAGTITFKPQHYKTVFTFYGPDNEPEGVIIKDEKWTLKKIVDKFAPTEEEQKEKLSTDLNNGVTNGAFYKEHTVIRAVFKDDNPVWDVPGFEKPSGEWISVYFEGNTSEDRKNDPLLIQQYFSRPFVVWDFDKKFDESISRTPAFDAIYDVITQQQISVEQLDNLKLKNRPPRWALEDHRNTIDFGPEGLNFASKDDFQFMPKQIDMVGDIRLSREELEFNGEKIKRWFHTDQFLKFTDLTNTLRQQPTATQIIKIAAELAVQVNPGIATYTTGFLADTDARMLDILGRQGRGPFSPDRLAEIFDIIAGVIGPDEAITVSLIAVFTGPLAKAQKIKQELDPILDGLGVADVLFERFPMLTNAIREYDTLQDLLKATGFPLKDLKPEEEYDEIVAALREAEAQQQQQLMAIETAKASKNLQGPVDETSVLAGVTG